MSESAPAPEDKSGFLNRLLRGGLWGFASNAVLHVLVLLRHLWLMRLLAPDVHGEWAIIYLTVIGLKTFSDLGIDKAVVHHVGGDRREVCSAAWLVLAARGVVLGLVILPAAPWVARFFDQPQLADLMRVTALVFVLEGLSSAGTIRLTRRLDFKRLFYIQIGANLAGFAAAVAGAWYFPSVRALVVAEVLRAGTFMTLSYVVAPVRPRLRGTRTLIRGLWTYARHVYSNSVLQYLLLSGPFIVVGRMLGGSDLGIFKSAFMFASIPALGLSEVLVKVMFPAFAQIRTDHRVTADTLRVTLRLSSVVVIPAIVLLVFLAPGIAAFGGPKWAALPAPLVILSVGTVLYCLRITAAPFFLGIGRPGLLTVTTLLNLAIMGLLIVPMTATWRLPGTAVACALGQLPAWIAAMQLMGRLTGSPALRIQCAAWSGIIPGAAVAGTMLLTWRVLGANDTPLYVLASAPPACVIAILVVLMMERKTLRQAAQVLRSQATAPASVESRETV